MLEERASPVAKSLGMISSLLLEAVEGSVGKARQYPFRSNHPHRQWRVEGRDLCSATLAGRTMHKRHGKAGSIASEPFSLCCVILGIFSVEIYPLHQFAVN